MVSDLQTYTQLQPAWRAGALRNYTRTKQIHVILCSFRVKHREHGMCQGPDASSASPHALSLTCSRRRNGSRLPSAADGRSRHASEQRDRPLHRPRSLPAPPVREAAAVRASRCGRARGRPRRRRLCSPHRPDRPHGRPGRSGCPRRCGHPPPWCQPPNGSHVLPACLPACLSRTCRELGCKIYTFQTVYCQGGRFSARSGYVLRIRQRVSLCQPYTNLTPAPLLRCPVSRDSRLSSSRKTRCVQKSRHLTDAAQTHQLGLRSPCKAVPLPLALALLSKGLVPASQPDR